MRVTFALWIAMVVCASTALGQTEAVLWRVGTCDNSYAEFGAAGHFEQFGGRFPGAVTFEIGRSEPAKDWPYVHPGPVDVWGGGRVRAYEIVFELKDEPKGAYLLRVDVVDTQMEQPPALELRANGKTIGEVQLQRGAGERSINDPRGGREQVATFFVPASSVVRGHNVLSLAVTKNSWLAYDCIEFVQRPDVKPVENVAARSTVFFRQSADKLQQLVAVTFDLYEPASPVVVTLEGDAIGRVVQSFEHLTPGLAREVKCEVPPLTAAQDVRVTVSAGGKDYSTTSRLVPQKQWKLYMLAQSHFDLGYTGLQEECLSLHRDNTEKAISWMAAHPTFAWTMEAMLAEDYIARGQRPTDFIELARQGRFGVQGFYGNMLTGLCSGEELSHSIDVYDRLRHEHGIESLTATMSDVPSMVATVPMILREHGISYLSLGGNFYRGPLKDDIYEAPHYWASPDGSRVLLWKSLNVLGVVPKPEQHRLSEAVFEEFLSRFVTRPNYPYDALLLHGFYTDNSNIHESVATIAEQWNRQYAYPQLIESRGPEFFQYVEEHFGSSIPTVTGDGGVFWEDGAGSSARETALTRTAKERLVCAEKLAALAGAADPQLRDSLAKAWRNVVLYDEHTWGDGESVRSPFTQRALTQWSVKKQFAEQAASLADDLLQQAGRKLAARVGSPGEAIVFNMSSWPRSEWVNIALLDGNIATVYAKDVPGLGYAILPASELKPTASQPADSEPLLENEFYRLQFDPESGAVASLVDKQLNRELVDKCEYKLNEYLYVTGAENSRILRGFSKDMPVPDLRIHRCASARFARSREPGRQVMRVTCNAPMTRSYVAQIILHDGEKRIDFVNVMDKEANLGKEAGYFAFPLALPSPQVRVEIPSGVIRPGLDQIVGGCRDWFAVQQFISVASDHAAVAISPLDTPLFTIDDINRGQWYESFSPRTGHVFAYAFNNYWDTNYRACQSGPLTMRFSLTSAASLTDTQAKRFGESVQSPLIGLICDGSRSTKSITAVSDALVSIDAPDVVIQSLRPARFDDGILLVLRNMSDREQRARVDIHKLAHTKAYLSNLGEDKREAIPVNGGIVDVTCRPLGLTTIMLAK